MTFLVFHCVLGAGDFGSAFIWKNCGILGIKLKKSAVLLFCAQQLDLNLNYDLFTE
jgi:hypothetical protein